MVIIIFANRYWKSENEMNNEYNHCAVSPVALSYNFWNGTSETKPSKYGSINPVSIESVRTSLSFLQMSLGINKVHCNAFQSPKCGPS